MSGKSWDAQFWESLGHNFLQVLGIIWGNKDSEILKKFVRIRKFWGNFKEMWGKSWYGQFWENLGHNFLHVLGIIWGNTDSEILMKFYGNVRKILIYILF